MPRAARRGSISSVSWGSNKSSDPDDLDEDDFDDDNDLNDQCANRWSDPSMKVDSPAGYYPPRYVDFNGADHGIGNASLSSPRSATKFSHPRAPPPPPAPSPRTGSPRLPMRIPPSPQKQQQQQKLSSSSLNQRPRIRRLPSSNIPIQNYGGYDATHDDSKDSRDGDAGRPSSYRSESYKNDGSSRTPPGRRATYGRTDMTGTIHYSADGGPEHYKENSNNNASASSNLLYVSDNTFDDTDFGDDTADEYTATNQAKLRSGSIPSRTQQNNPRRSRSYHPEDILPTKQAVDVTSPMSDDMSSPKSERKSRKKEKRKNRRRRFSLTSVSSASPRKQERAMKGGFGGLDAISPKSKKEGRWARFKFGSGGGSKNNASNPLPPSAPSLLDDSIAAKSLIDDSINDVNFEYLLHHPSSMVARANAAAKRRRKQKKRYSAPDAIATNNEKAMCQPPRRRLSIPRGNKGKNNDSTNYRTPSQVDYSMSMSISMSEESDIFSSDYDEFTISRQSPHDSFILPEPPEPPREALEATRNKGDGDHGRKLIDLIQKLSIRAAMAMTRSNNRATKASKKAKKANAASSQEQQRQQQQQQQQHYQQHAVKPRTSNTTASTLGSSQRRGIRT